MLLPRITQLHQQGSDFLKTPVKVALLLRKFVEFVGVQTFTVSLSPNSRRLLRPANDISVVRQGFKVQPFHHRCGRRVPRTSNPVFTVFQVFLPPIQCVFTQSVERGPVLSGSRQRQSLLGHYQILIGVSQAGRKFIVR